MSVFITEVNFLGMSFPLSFHLHNPCLLYEVFIYLSPSDHSLFESVVMYIVCTSHLALGYSALSYCLFLTILIILTIRL